MSNIELEVGELSVADMLVAIEADEAMSASAKRRYRRDITCGCKWLVRQPEQISASPRKLANILAGLSAGGLGISEGRLSNVKTAFRKGSASLNRTTAIPHARRLIPAWQRLKVMIHDPYSFASVSRFMGYASANDISPNEVDDVVSSRFLSWMTEGCILAKPRQRHQVFVNGWNRLSTEIPEWPKLHLTVPRYSQTWSLPWSEFPEELSLSIDAYLARMASDDPFDLDAPVRPLTTNTIKSYRERLRVYVSALHLAGYDVAKLRSLDDIVEIDTASLGLRTLCFRAQPPRRALAAQTASLLTRIAKSRLAEQIGDLRPELLNARQENIAKLQKLSRKLTTGDGLSVKNRKRLAPLRDEGVLAKLLLLPITIARSLERVDNPTYRQSLLAQKALMLLILIYCPLRITSLLSLRLDRHLCWSRPNMSGELMLEFQEGELKNRQPASMPLPADCARFVRTYIRKFRPITAHQGSPFLFPGEGACLPKGRNVASAQISSLIFQRLGLAVNPHLYRHIVHLIVLRRFPGAYAMVARILTHKSIESTIRNYSSFDVELSMRAYQRMVLDAGSGVKPDKKSTLGVVAYHDWNGV